MPYFDEEGKEIEGILSLEEVEAQQTEALNKYKEENPDYTEKVADLEEKLQKAEEKETNFAKLRKIAEDKGIKLEEKEGQLGEQGEQFDKFREETQNEIAELRNEIADNSEADAIDDLTDDPEERKKIQYYMKKLSKPEDDHETYEKNLNDAYFLTTKQEAQIPDYLSSAGAGGGKHKEELSSSEKELGNNLGITDADREKYSK